MMRIACVLLMALLLGACASKGDAVEDRYYSLVLASDAIVPMESLEATDGKLVVGPIQLPNYLLGRALSMQRGTNRIESASHHFWAEPLDSAIAKVLVRDIADNTSGLQVDRESGRWTIEADCRVRVEFDALHPTYESRTVTRGRYWLITDDGEQRREFSYPQTLTEDGYAHAVNKLRDSLRELAETISEDVSKASCKPPPAVGAASQPR